MDPSEAVESLIRERVGRLERFEDRIIACHVVVDVPHRHQAKGRHFAVRLDIATPDGEIAVTRDPAQDGSHEEMSIVVRDAFDAARRILEDDARRRRGDVKTHSTPTLPTH